LFLFLSFFFSLLFLGCSARGKTGEGIEKHRLREWEAGRQGGREGGIECSRERRREGGEGDVESNIMMRIARGRRKERGTKEKRKRERELSCTG